MLRIIDCDTGESQAEFVDSYTGMISLQVGWAPGVKIDVDMVEAEYISVLISHEKEEELFDLLFARRNKRLPTLSPNG